MSQKISGRKIELGQVTDTREDDILFYVSN